MNNQSNIETLIYSNKHVVTIDDLALLWQVGDRLRLFELIKYYVRSGKLTRVHKGIYAYGQYSPLDLAQKLVPMSYVSLYTTAQMHGLIFQNYQTVFCMSSISKSLEINNQKYEYHKLKQEVFYGPLGIENSGQYSYANKERTICDMLYVYPNICFDNLGGIDAAALKEIASIYNNKRLSRDITRLIKSIKD
jgi:predicted transcriptional regulator of viral defense system